MRTLIIDTRQQEGKHEAKHRYFDVLDFGIKRTKIDAGDYMFEGGHVSVDTKANIQELYLDLCGRHKSKARGTDGKPVWIQNHDVFRRECQRATDAGIKLFVLVETEHVSNLAELAKWREPNNEYYKRGGRAEHFNQKAARYNKAAAFKQGVPQRIYGKRLAQTCETMQERYGVTFLFCEPRVAGQRVIELLETQEPTD